MTENYKLHSKGENWFQEANKGKPIYNYTIVDQVFLSRCETI